MSHGKRVCAERRMMGQSLGDLAQETRTWLATTAWRVPRQDIAAVALKRYGWCHRVQEAVPPYDSYPCAVCCAPCDGIWVTHARVRSLICHDCLGGLVAIIDRFQLADDVLPTVMIMSDDPYQISETSQALARPRCTLGRWLGELCDCDGRHGLSCAIRGARLAMQMALRVIHADVAALVLDHLPNDLAAIVNEYVIWDWCSLPRGD